MDFDLTSRLGLTVRDLEMQRALAAMRTPPALELALNQTRAYAALAESTNSAQIVAAMKGMTDVTAMAMERLNALDAATYRAIEMLDGRAAIEAARASMGFDHLATLRHDGALAELFDAARKPLDLEYLVRDASVARDRLRSAVGGGSFDPDRVLDSLRQPPRIIGAFEFPDLDIEGAKRSRDIANHEDPDGILSEEAHDRLARVEFLPIRVIYEIRRRPEMMKLLSPRQFEEMTAELLSGLGFEDVRLTPRSRDGGRDVVAVHRAHGIPVLCAFECKQYTKNRVQLATLRGLLGTIVHAPTMANIGVLVTTSRFTCGARQFILSEVRVDGKDFDDLVTWLGQYRRR